jgi:hypothetical protein
MPAYYLVVQMLNGSLTGLERVFEFRSSRAGTPEGDVWVTAQQDQRMAAQKIRG